MKFDLDKSLNSADWLIDFIKQTSFEPNHPMGMVAQSDVEQIIGLMFIGRGSDVHNFLQMRCEWLDITLPAGGPFPLHTAHMYRARALGAWLDASNPAHGLWKKAGEFYMLARNTPAAPWTKKEIVAGLDDNLAFAAQAGELGQGDAIWEAAIADYESKIGHGAPSLAKVLTSRDYGYALLLGISRGTYDLIDLQKAGRKLLKRNLDREWIGRGQFSRAAMWLKIIHCDLDRRINGPMASVTPVEALLKAWDDMPDDGPRPPLI